MENEIVTGGTTDELEVKDYLIMQNSKEFTKYRDTSKMKSIHGRKMTNTTKTKIKESIKFLLDLKLRGELDKKYVFRFMTLTLGEKIDKTNYVPIEDDQKVSHQFRMMLKTMVKNYGMESYVWVAERQENGQIHFHLFCLWNNDTYKIGKGTETVRKLNALWNKHLFAIGFDTISEKWKKSASALEVKQEYERAMFDCNKKGLHTFYQNEHKHRNPFDDQYVKGVANSLSLSSYMTKYVTKSDDTFYCNVWGRSKALSKMTSTKIVMELSKQDFEKLSRGEIQRTRKKIVRSDGKEFIHETSSYDSSLWSYPQFAQFHKKFKSRYETELETKIYLGEDIKDGVDVCSPIESIEPSLTDKGKFIVNIYGFRGSKLPMGKVIGETIENKTLKMLLTADEILKSYSEKYLMMLGVLDLVRPSDNYFVLTKIYNYAYDTEQIKEQRLFKNTTIDKIFRTNKVSNTDYIKVTKISKELYNKLLDNEQQNKTDHQGERP
ncbi:inovirus Gp2 family protein [Flammeovirga sp. MY04]|uniref:rolling circle replication-associated protein n=1 Tax=Flammeovirga sp. MY04 TaxID=1191459 RepID=UPI0008060D4D|nr:inovirus-type Gp2 protein [Flammeovirga sp. MY04]ANQ48493.1 inovirus Gp2 family protein [Flammeovirga sp. MY04]